MALETYRKDSDFKKTPEPSGKKRQTKSGNSFVLQKHAARQQSASQKRGALGATGTHRGSGFH
ncbi:MAG: hypothetical protein ACREUI_09505 [Burkholderiales bacterium]